MMATLATRGCLLGLTFILLNLLSLSMCSILCALSSPSYLCESNVRNRRDNGPGNENAVLRSYPPKSIDTQQRAGEKDDDDEIKRSLERGRSPEDANSNFEVVADWSGTTDGHLGAGSRDDKSFASRHRDGHKELMEDLRWRHLLPHKENAHSIPKLPFAEGVLDPHYMLLGIGRRRR